MARAIERLTATEVAKKKAPGYQHDGAGLYLQIAETGSKSWIFRYTLAGKTREMGLGSLNAFSLAEARERARLQRKLLADGIDPITARDALRAQEAHKQANTLTFAECAKRYIAANRAGWHNDKHAEQWQNTLDRYANPVIGKLAVHAVDTPRILRILEPIWSDKPETASRVRGRVEHVLDWAKVHGYRAGENPARWRGHLDKILPKRGKVKRVEHHAALPYAEINAFLQDLRKQPGTAPQGLEFAILTVARTGEVRGAKWPEFDFEKALWVVPAARMKAGKEHRVPLTPRALEILKAQSRDNDYVFAGRWHDKPMSDGAMLMALERMNRSDITAHGFRSTFRDWAGETTSHPREVIEHALAHQLKDKAEAAYQRGDLFEKRRRLMLEWARYCDTPQQKGKVVSMTGRKRA